MSGLSSKQSFFMKENQVTKPDIAIMWHRRDLRLYDNHALAAASKSGFKILPLFIFDEDILHKLPSKKDARVEFIHHELRKLAEDYSENGGTLLVKKGNPMDIFRQILEDFTVKAVFFNKDYEPYARQRDAGVKELLQANGAGFHGFKDHVIFEETDVLKSDGTPYTIYTPYMKRWKQQFVPQLAEAFEVELSAASFLKTAPFHFPTLDELGFEPSGIIFPDKKANKNIIADYHETRNTPAIKGTTRLGLHLRFGTVSIREMIRIAINHNETWQNELIWREFFQMILFHFPHTVDKSFKPAYDRIAWVNDEKQFKAWCEGRTGFPIVDAGMRELSATGFMHNRVRMITGSFLVKDLLIDWRWGEAWFAEKLLDYEQASNVGNWQWVAGCGCDAAPYFRVFNPELQAKKFDPDGKYIRRWVPEFDSLAYLKPIIDHDFAKKRVIKVFKEALGKE
jgi:deoxyribodipyrimidine photo-lyase